MTRDKYRGALLGLAIGDALVTALEFKPPGIFTPITDMIGGGPFGLKPGEWTDDTSMALCLAESLIERRGFDPKDQMNRYCRWHEDGYLSSNGSSAGDSPAQFPTYITQEDGTISRSGSAFVRFFR